MEKSKITNTENSISPILTPISPSFIEEQEKNGQKELIEANSQLPVESSGGIDTAKVYESIGIKVIGESKGDNLFYDVVLPDGWKLKDTEHSMWSELLDSKDRKRAAIFYKASFYDRKAHISFFNKINRSVDRLGFLNGDYSAENGNYKSYKTPFVGRVTDFDGSVLFETEHIECDVEYQIKNGKQYGYTKEYIEKSENIENKLKILCIEFLERKYPEYNNPSAYWD